MPFMTPLRKARMVKQACAPRPGIGQGTVMGFVRNVAAVLLTTAVSIPLGLLTGVILARYLSLVGRGEYALLVYFSALICVLSQLGWPEAAIHRVRRHRVPAVHAFTTGLLSNLMICAVVFTIVMAARPWLSPLVLHGAW